MSMPAPDHDANGLPLCSYDECPQYDGKRCYEIGMRPDRFCEPSLIEIVQTLRKLQKGRSR